MKIIIICQNQGNALAKKQLIFLSILDRAISSMKTKLLTICLLLLTSQVFAEECKGTDVSKWDNCHGIFSFSNGDKYVGAYKNGKQHGHGTFTYHPVINRIGNEYVGEWKDGKRSGHGTFTYFRGQKYVGEWEDDKRNGHGKQSNAKGWYYVGEFKDHLRHGHGKMTYADGVIFEGEWKDDLRNGHGTLTYNNRNKKVGKWRNNKFIGE